MTTTLRRTPVARLLTISLCIGALAVAGCNKTDTPSAPAPAPAAPVATAPAPPAPAPAPVAYTPPSAEQLYQLVAPIALYPDKLVAQVLAGSTYPDQITAAHGWLAQNAALRGGPLADAANQQPWDPSVKSLTAFRPVLDQMAGNIAWTEALGQAYYNDPADVMNAIQVMRQRAQAAGRLKTNNRLRVASAATPRNYAPAPDVQPVYAGPAVVEPPPQFITIEPAQPDVVYVPSYDPQRIYGEPVPVYPGYAYAPPVEAAPGYSRGQMAAAGAFTFGLGVVVGAALERHDWGWRSWDMNWGAPRYRDRDRAVAPAYARPAVVYNNSTYISRSTTVVNNVRNVYNNNAPRGLPPGAPAPNFAAAPGLPPPHNAQFAQQQQQQQQQQREQQARQQQAFMRQQQEQQQAGQQAQQLQARQRQQAQQERQARLQQQQQQQQDRAQRQQAQQAQQQERQARQQARNIPQQPPQALLQQQQQEQARRQQAQQQQQQARAASRQAQQQQQQQAMQERQQQRQSAQQEQSRRQQQMQQQAQQQARVLQQQQPQQQQVQRQQAQQQARQQQQEQMHRQQQQQAQAARQQQQQQQQRQQQQAQQQAQQVRQQHQQQQAQQHAAAAAAAHRRPPGRPGEPPKDQP
ncbi:DUF3300 domain-containing protein [Variovorax paradoxus]|uniref:DUF3300 domain-containing protein n=1 Tax=Variovorax paradoxus TaxID=34073 RepID=UPI00277D558D|nr:DUF3300 domain-containing protein [Variovorax paradoxus]MDQ0586955.1 hypothetical protein [Variovorax paradoxus]